MENRFGKSVRQSGTALLLAAGLVSGAANATLLTVEPDGVVLETSNPYTGARLEWEQSPSSSLFNWADAVTHAAGVATDGGGFHLATLLELNGLYDDLIVAGVCSGAGFGASCTGNIGGFTFIQPNYWSGTEVVPGFAAESFLFNLGGQLLDSEIARQFAWAVRAGDVDVAAAPEPATLALLGLGLAGLGFSRRKQA